MVSFGKYLLEVSLCIGVVLAIYILLLRGRTFFQLNRIYLLGGLVLSLILPLISLPQHLAKKSETLSILSLEKIETEYIPFNFQKPDTSVAFDITSVFLISYIIGVIFFGLRFSFHCWTLFRLTRSSRKSTLHGVDLYIRDSSSVFSFYKYIFAPADVESIVLRHEHVHVKQGHWIDNLFLELVAIALWFNPLIRLYRRAVKEQHEYLADQGAVANQADVSAYLLVLLKTAYSNNGLAFASYFGSNTIKNRIIMLTKNKTPLYQTMFYFLLVPAVALLLFAFQEAAGPTVPKATQAVSGAQSVPDGAPIEADKVKSTIGFGERLHPATSKKVNHTGIDLVADEGVNVVATADGVVVETTFNDLKGNFVVIRHSDQFSTQYFHLLKSTVSKGSSVKKGQLIGQVGSTGVLSTNNHLHYEILKDGVAVNPVEYLPKGYIF